MITFCAIAVLYLPDIKYLPVQIAKAIIPTHFVFTLWSSSLVSTRSIFNSDWARASCGEYRTSFISRLAVYRRSSAVPVANQFEQTCNSPGTVIACFVFPKHRACDFWKVDQRRPEGVNSTFACAENTEPPFHTQWVRFNKKGIWSVLKLKL